jgi:hypothetical protein
VEAAHQLGEEEDDHEEVKGVEYPAEDAAGDGILPARRIRVG